MPQNLYSLLYITSHNPEHFARSISSLPPPLKYASLPGLNREIHVQLTMSYETRIHNPSTFRQRASNQKNFDQLYEDKEWTSGVSSWGRQELFAAGVICTAPSTNIDLLRGFYPDPDNRLSQPLNRFINGPPSMDDLGQKWDPELVRGTNPECLGLVWTALAEFVRRENLFRPVAAPPAASDSSRPPRLAAEASREKTREVQRITGELRSSRAPSATSTSSGSLLGYVEPTDMPLLEGSTIRLVSSLCGLVLIYGQSRRSTRPPLIWRADNSVYSFVGSTTNAERTISAADDGGIQMWDPTRRVFRQVALLEAKRTLEFANGEPVVTDNVLAQMVGQALALHRSSNPLYVAASPERSMTILATAYFIKFYIFEFPQEYDANYEGQSMTTPDCHLRVYSTRWLNIQRTADRGNFVKHLLAIISWANSL